MNRDLEFIKSLAGYLKFSIDDENSPDNSLILDTLSHDIFGYLRKEVGFVPRTKNYKKYLQDR